MVPLWGGAALLRPSAFILDGSGPAEERHHKAVPIGSDSESGKKATICEGRNYICIALRLIALFFIYIYTSMLGA